MLQRQPGYPDRDRAEDEQPGQSLVRCGNATVPNAAEEAGNDSQPVAPEVDDQADGGGYVEAHDKCQVRRLGCADVQVSRPATAQHRRDENAVAQAADRKQLTDPLKQPDHGRLEPSQIRRHDGKSLPSTGKTRQNPRERCDGLPASSQVVARSPDRARQFGRKQSATGRETNPSPRPESRGPPIATDSNEPGQLVEVGNAQAPGVSSTAARRRRPGCIWPWQSTQPAVRLRGNCP